MRARWFSLVVVMALYTSIAFGSPIPRFVFVDGSERLADRIDCDRYDAGPGFSLAVLHDGVAVFERQCGLADVERHVPIDAETRFRAPGLARTMLATAVLMLHQQGDLALDDTLADHFPQLPPWAGEVRLLDVLRHTAGFPETPVAPGGVLDVQDALRVLRGRRRLEFEPGSAANHTVTGDLLLGELVERASELSLAEFLDRRVLRPLDMNDTLVTDERPTDLAHAAIDYGRSASAWGPVELYTTTRDAARWYRATLGNELLAADTAVLMFHHPVTHAGALAPLAMGWSDRSPTDGRHAGVRVFESSDESSVLTFYPDERLCVILLGNAGQLPGFLDETLPQFLIRVPQRRDRYPAEDPFGRQPVVRR